MELRYGSENEGSDAEHHECCRRDFEELPPLGVGVALQYQPQPSADFRESETNKVVFLLNNKLMQADEMEGLKE